MLALALIIMHGLLIGIFVSAPMGPTGVLVIQRTLNKGRNPAFFTGLGASLSDLIYCLLSGLGLAFVTDFIESNKEIIQIAGSVFLMAYCLYLFLHNPSRQLQAQATMPKNETPWKDFLTGFLFTFANPLILFFIIGLFARFNFLDAEYRWWHYVAGYLAICAGAMAWWWAVTFFVTKVRHHFNVRSMWIINRAIGVLLLIMAVIGIFTGVNALRG